MLLNISNHPKSSWSKEQISQAESIYGVIIDIPFPEIDPESSLEEIKKLAEQYSATVLDYISSIYNKNTEGNSYQNVVHLMGEFTFVFNLLEKLKILGIKAVNSTTSRESRSISNKTGTEKISVFKFVKFREYY